MKYEFNLFYRAITGDLLSPNSVENEKATFHYYQLLLSKEVERIKRTLHKKAFGQSSEDEIRNYVRNQQRSLQTLMEMLIGKFGEEEKAALGQLTEEYSLYGIHKIVYTHLEAVVLFLEQYFSVYLDPEVAVPYRLRFDSLVAARQQIGQLRAKLSESGLSRQVIELVLLPLDRLAAMSQEAITYREWRFAEKYQSVLTTLLQSEGIVVGGEQLSQFFQQLNFNHSSSFHFCTNLIGQEIAQLEETEDRLESLWYQLKVFKQTPPVTDAIYHPQYPPLREQIIRWIEEEINFWQKKRDFKKIYLRDERAIDAHAKIQTSLSVADLAYLSRVLYETQVFTNAQQKDILRIIAQHFSSLRQESISLQSLTTRYYSTEDTARQTVKKLAQRIIRHIDSAR